MGKGQFFVIVWCLLFLAGYSVFGQRSEITKKNSTVKNFSSHKFKKNKRFAAICPTFYVSEFPYQSIGVKIGDPIALTYKFYASNTFAFGIDIGKASEGLYSQLHRDRFNSIPEPTDTTYFYVSHNVLNQNVFSAKVFYYKEGPKSIKGLDLYLGAGYQMQFVDIKYDYIAIRQSPPETRETQQAQLSFTPLGLEVIGGLEYAYFSIPISVFAEMGIFFGVDEIQRWQKFQGGMGIRYVF